MMRFTAAAVLALTGLPCNEAIRGRDITSRNSGAVVDAKDISTKGLNVQNDQASIKAFVAESHARENSMMEQMSVNYAMDIIREKAPTEFSALQQELDVAKKGNKHLRKQPDGGVAAAQAAGAYSSGAQKALDMLNKMLLEATEKMDFEVVRCNSEERTNLAQLAEIRADIVMFNGMAAGAATTMNKAKGDATRFEGLLADTKAEFEKSSSTCTTERTDLEQKIKVVSGDLEVMKKVVALTDCGDSAAATFYQCIDTRTNRTWTQMKSQPKLQDEIAKLRNPNVRKILESGQIFLEGNSAQEPAGSGLTEPEAGATTGDAMQTTKCSLSSSPQCPKIREKFTDLAGEVLDSFNELSLMLRNLNLHCEETNAAISAMINNYDTVISETNGKLTDATKDWGTYSGQKSQKDGEEQDVHKEHMDTMTGCKVNIENLASEKCALKKIRGELLNMDSLPSNITDCEIGEWQEEPCSVECGGGTQKLTRSLTTGWKGTACPAGEAEQSCEEQRCPVDCIMEEWSEWGACTALCDGGIKEKSRGIKVPALTKAAVQCEATAETVPCNQGACSGNCELSDWTAWATECNKPCGGGEVTRVKTLLKPAFGTGTCPAFYDEERYELKACNTLACPPTEVPMTCTSKTDVIILIDGSASIGREGWEQMVNASAQLARSFSTSETEAKVATLLFSGPTNFDHVGPCIGMIKGLPPNETAINAIDDCGMQWITRFADNKTGEAVAEDIAKMEWPQATTLTSMALAQAKAELAHGRKDANSVVIVLTDGAPLSVLECSKQAESLKKQARLMFVPVGNQFADDSVFQPWASRPWKDNIVRVKDVEDVAKPFTINQILTNFCPQLFLGNETIAELLVPEVSVFGGA